MYFLGKAFKVRGKIHGDEEKPFLAHLEDLRAMITKIVITLLISTVLCWVFHKQLIEVMSKPVHEVWEARQSEKLPASMGITTDEWEEIKKIQAVAVNLTPGEQRDSYYRAFDKESTQFLAESAGFYIAAMQIPDKEARDAWVATIPDTTEEHRKLVAELVEKGPAVAIGAKNKVVAMKSLKPTETFMLAFKLAFYAGLTISFPINLWFVLQFVLPGLKHREKKVMWPALTVGFGLFLMGGLFSYFVVLPKALDFFFTFGTDMGVQNEWRIGEYISFATQFTLIFGLAFELPVLVMTLVKLGLVNYKTMSNTRTYAVLAIIVIAALITPTGDVLTLSMLAAPMYVLYELCIVLAYFDYRKEKRLEQEERERSGVRQNPEVVSASGTISMNDSESDSEFYDEEPDLEDHEDEPDLEDHEDHEDASAHYHGFEDHHDEHAYYDHDDEHQYDEYSDYRDPEHYYSEESEEEAVSESEGDEGDSDSYQENLKARGEEGDTEPGEQDSTFNPGAHFEQDHGLEEVSDESVNEASSDAPESGDTEPDEENRKRSSSENSDPPDQEH